MRRIVANGLGLLALLLAGCGFHLRGPVELAPELRVIYVQSQLAIGSPPGALSRKLPVVLARNGVAVTRDPAQATAILTILNEGGGRRTMAADRFDVKREYTLVYGAAYDVKRPNGQVLIGAEGISANRAVLFDENRVLGFEAAQESLTDSMAEDMAWQILRRLQAFKA
ncbi:MAG: hypothetical protein JNM60_03230 [Candidatus Competibacteraceae bacterium]|nr:hypothetical protein [Candidatus Competibacteraceae bacterium]